MNKLFIAALLFALFAACTNHKNQSKNAAGASSKFANDKDFVCGMAISDDFTDTVRYEGKLYGFCSESCKETFLESPQKYLTAK